ncbi:hypothetical protein D7Z26_07290 [Cohnella endophytica]|uniref:Ger(X)C family spore germination protein n=1 Tax=Cohnella endophytica TaxID=2419778 RepID=A0A494XWP8_9BACL|nr:Ger(x)C family spore germination C-terminal domain-containing protein [Cohnella endophytica]RKP55027.1 hypothetical protein D7Z26_07290 [Cohnella endophytica]
MKRALICFPVLFIFVAILSGCWDVKDINKRYLPVVMGISKGQNDNYRIILQVPDIKGGTQFLEGESKSISKAVEIIRTKAEKEVDLMHVRLFLISQELAQQGIKNIVDFAMRSNDISIKSMVAIVSGDFEKTLFHEIKRTPEVSSYDYFSEEAGWTPDVSINRLWEAYRSVYSYTEDFAVPLVQAGERTLFEFQGSAIMSRDRMVGTLSANETLINNIFQERYMDGTIELSSDASILIKKATIRNKARWRSSGPNLQSRIHLVISILENKNEKTNAEIALEIKGLLEKRAHVISDKLRSLKADILGNGQAFRPIMNDQQLKNWKETWFPQLNHQITVTVNVRDNQDYKEEMK